MRVVQLPMRVPFRGVTLREAALWEGPNGWTEWSPFLEYGSVESARWLAGALAHGWGSAPRPVRDKVPVNGTIPAIAPDVVPSVIARFPGFKTFKVKVAAASTSLADDVARLTAVRAAVGDSVNLRVDVNARWSIDQALQAAEAFAPFNLEYIEQPVASVQDMTTLRTKLAGDVKIAADENIRKASDPQLVAQMHAADVVIIKAQPLGGSGLEIAQSIGMPTVVSSALDTAVGLSWGARLAAAVPDLPYACGLATSRLFTDDVAELDLADGYLSTAPVTPEPTKLRKYAASPDRVQWWHERLNNAYPHLGEHVTFDS